MARLGRFDPTAARRLGVTLVFATGGGAALAAFGVPAIPTTALIMSLTALATLSLVFPRDEKPPA